MIAQGSENATGKLGKMASFMAGGWGIAAGVAISLGTLLWSELTKVDKASDDASSSTIDFSNSLVAQQNIVANSVDGIKQLEEATRGLINTQAILLDNLQSVSKASVAQLNSQLSDLDKNIARLSKTTPAVSLNPLADWLWKKGGGSDSASEQLVALKEERDNAAAALVRAQAALATTTVGLEERAAIEGVDADARARGEIERARARLRERRRETLTSANGVPLAAGGLEQISKSDFDKEMAELQRRENALKDKKKPKKDNSAAKAAREAERLAQFGERAEDAIARLNDQFNTAPRDIDQARQATAKLDDIIADLEKRKPKNFEELIAQAKAVKPLIQDSLQRPIREMLEDQQRQIALGGLQVQGREAEAEALKLTYALMDKMGVESEEQLAIELKKRGISGEQVQQLYDNLGVMREQTRELREQQALQQAFLNATGDMRENVRLTLEGLRRHGPRAIEDFAKRSVDVFDRLFSEVATEKLFGKFFNELEDQITGADHVSDAGKRMAKAVDQASGEIVDLGKAAASATSAIKGAAGGTNVPDGWIVGDDGKAFDPNAPITVTGDKLLGEFKKGFKEGFSGFFDELKGDFNDVFSDVFGKSGIFNKGLGETLGQLTAGAQTGAMAGNLVTGILGLKGSSTGGAIGGAIGTAIAGPLGSVVGGTLGSVVGGLLKKTKTGSANITSVTDDATVSGNSSAFKQAASAAAGSVQDGLSQIAEMLGGAIGSFNVTIGQRHGDWRVRAGTGSLKVAKGATEFDDDQEGAIAYAIQLAVSQGAVTGLSAAVEKALKSSTDLNAALEEALKVQEIEILVGGLGAELESQFKAFEIQAKERVRIATQYGFDVVAIEKKNAEDRAALVEEMLEQQVGSLQRLVDEMTYGSLFEGSALEQRDAILKEIEQAKADLAAGKDGAADTLATLLQQLNSVSEEAYGSTGQYAADRTMILDLARNEIAQANAQILQAAASAGSSTSATSDPALATTNAQLDENNDQNAKVIALLETLVANGQAVSNAASGLDLAALTRTS